MAESENSLVIYVKASTRDSKTLGADIVCHRVMMMVALKKLELKADIVPIDLIKKTNVTLDFPYKKLPTFVMEYEGKQIVREEPFDIEEAFEKIEPSLKVDSEDINKFISVGPGTTFYHKFNQFIKNQDPSADPILREHLATELKKVNSFLLSDKTPKNESNNIEFLGGSTPMLPDCYLLPKLHYTYVALSSVKGFEFECLKGIEQYLECGRKHPVFTCTCPSRANIVDFYCRQANISDKKCAEILRKVEKEEA